MTTIVALLILVTLLLLATGAVLLYIVRRPLPKTSGTIYIPILRKPVAPGRPEEPVEVIRDRHGVPHIYATSRDDLFFAQGFVHAQDRFWQMELQRRAGSGRLSEIFGETTLEADRFFRTIGLHRAALAEMEALDPRTRESLASYAAGVNAYMAAQRGSLSLEFDLLRYQPEPWQPVDGLYLAKLLAWNLSGNWARELVRARFASELGADLAAQLEPELPADNPAIASGPGMPQGAPPPPNGGSRAAFAEMLRCIEGLLGDSSPARVGGSTPAGMTSAPGNSNQWAVSGSRSATGKPLLANDTHLPLTMPSQWYQIHLQGGGLHVAGVSFPGLPGVIIGHNEHCAWGATVAFQDAQDLFIERMNPENPYQYEFEGAWLHAEQVLEEIQVKGWDSPHVEEVVITHHGPIISQVVGERLPLALRWVGHEPSNILGSALRYMGAASCEEFCSSLEDWSSPAQNFVHADVHGSIAFLQAGWMPVRTKGYGMAPIPGWTGEHEWNGYLSLDQLPQAHNPDSGWLATANHLVVDESYPHFVSADVDHPARAQRVVQLITAEGEHTIDDFCRFQLDTYSSQAARFVSHLLQVEPRTEEEEQALALLREWDHHLETASVAASIYQVARLRALHLFFDNHLGEVAPDYIGSGQLAPLVPYGPYHGRSFVRLLSLLEEPDGGLWLTNPAPGDPAGQASAPPCRSALLRQALDEALSLLKDHLGPDMDAWEWERLNRVHFAHPVGSVRPLNLLFNRGPYPCAGDQDTLLRSITAPRFPFEPVVVGDAVRFVADLDDWEQCRIMVPGGQSGHIASRHYGDRIRQWLRGDYQPMHFRRDIVEQHAAQRLYLVPSNRSP